MVSLAVQLAVLARLDEPRSTGAIADELVLAEVDVEEAVGGLEAAGLVEREGFGAKTRLVPAAPEIARRAGQVHAQLDREAWQALFDRERAQLAHVLARLGRLELAAAVLGEPVEAVRADAYELVEAGVMADEPFALVAAMPALGELLAEIDELRARQWVRERAREAEVVHHLGPEIVFTAEASIGEPDVGYGGVSLLGDHGAEVEPEQATYCRTHRDLDASDAILQALLTHPEDERVLEACRAVFVREPTPTFREKAQIYGLEDQAAAIHREGAE